MIWLLGLVVIFLTYFYVKNAHSYWKKRDVLQTNPFFFFGDSWNIFLGKKTLIEMIQSIYKKGEGKRYIGFYQMMSPALMVRDLELIKQITVKDFDHFLDHRTYVTEDIDPVWNKNLFALKGQRWRDMRVTLSPAFTSGKMKLMFQLMLDGIQNFIRHLQEQEQPLVTLEMRDVCGRITIDTIANTAYGVRVDSFKNPNNDFYLAGGEVNFSTLWQNIKFSAYFNWNFMTPILLFFRVPLFSWKIYNFFKSLMVQTIEMREQKGTVRPDMVHLLMEARKGKLKEEEDEKSTVDTGFATAKPTEQAGKMKAGRQIELTIDDISAQALIFFIGGGDTTSSLMSFLAYELCANPDVQQQLREEVLETSERCNGKLTYNDLVHMKYLDMVVSETLRKWPIAAFLFREVTKPYRIQPESPDESPVELNINDIIWIPVAAIHYDERYYENPDKFIPERFNEENRKSINPYAYLPFGIGPRICIGSRYAILSTKIFAWSLLEKFEIVPVAKTQIPLKLSKKSMILQAENGIWVGLKPLKK